MTCARTSSRGAAPLVLALLAAAVCYAPLHAAEQPLWEVGLGIGVLGYENYRGADTSHVYPVPVPYVAYNGPILKADQEGVRGFLFDRKWVEVNLSGDFTMPVSNDRTRSGMPQLKPTIEAGVMVGFSSVALRGFADQIGFAGAGAPGLHPANAAAADRLDADAGVQIESQGSRRTHRMERGGLRGSAVCQPPLQRLFLYGPLSKCDRIAAGIPGGGRLRGNAARYRLDEALSSLLVRVRSCATTPWRVRCLRTVRWCSAIITGPQVSSPPG